MDWFPAGISRIKKGKRVHLFSNKDKDATSRKQPREPASPASFFTPEVPLMIPSMATIPSFPHETRLKWPVGQQKTPQPPSQSSAQSQSQVQAMPSLQTNSQTTSFDSNPNASAPSLSPVRAHQHSESVPSMSLPDLPASALNSTDRTTSSSGVLPPSIPDFLTPGNASFFEEVFGRKSLAESSQNAAKTSTSTSSAGTPKSSTTSAKPTPTRPPPIQIVPNTTHHRQRSNLSSPASSTYTSSSDSGSSIYSYVSAPDLDLDDYHLSPNGRTTHHRLTRTDSFTLPNDVWEWAPGSAGGDAKAGRGDTKSRIGSQIRDSRRSRRYSDGGSTTVGSTSPVAWSVIGSGPGSFAALGAGGGSVSTAKRISRKASRRSSRHRSTANIAAAATEPMPDDAVEKVKLRTSTVAARRNTSVVDNLSASGKNSSLTSTLGPQPGPSRLPPVPSPALSPFPFESPLPSLPSLPTASSRDKKSPDSPPLPSLPISAPSTSSLSPPTSSSLFLPSSSSLPPPLPQPNVSTSSLPSSSASPSHSHSSSTSTAGVIATSTPGSANNVAVTSTPAGATAPSSSTSTVTAVSPPTTASSPPISPPTSSGSAYALSSNPYSASSATDSSSPASSFEEVTLDSVLSGYNTPEGLSSPGRSASSSCPGGSGGGSGGAGGGGWRGYQHQKKPSGQHSHSHMHQQGYQRHQHQHQLSSGAPQHILPPLPHSASTSTAKSLESGSGVLPRILPPRGDSMIWGRERSGSNATLNGSMTPMPQHAQGRQRSGSNASVKDRGRIGAETGVGSGVTAGLGKGQAVALDGIAERDSIDGNVKDLTPHPGLGFNGNAYSNLAGGSGAGAGAGPSKSPHHLRRPSATAPGVGGNPNPIAERRPSGTRERSGSKAGKQVSTVDVDKQPSDLDAGRRPSNFGLEGPSNVGSVTERRPSAGNVGLGAPAVGTGLKPGSSHRDASFTSTVTPALPFSDVQESGAHPITSHSTTSDGFAKPRNANDPETLPSSSAPETGQWTSDVPHPNSRTRIRTDSNVSIKEAYVAFEEHETLVGPGTGPVSSLKASLSAHVSGNAKGPSSVKSTGNSLKAPSSTKESISESGRSAYHSFQSTDKSQASLKSHTHSASFKSFPSIQSGASKEVFASSPIDPSPSTITFKESVLGAVKAIAAFTGGNRDKDKGDRDKNKDGKAKDSRVTVKRRSSAPSPRVSGGNVVHEDVVLSGAVDTGKKRQEMSRSNGRLGEVTAEHYAPSPSHATMVTGNTIASRSRDELNPVLEQHFSSSARASPVPHIYTNVSTTSLPYAREMLPRLTEGNVASGSAPSLMYHNSMVRLANASTMSLPVKQGNMSSTSLSASEFGGYTNGYAGNSNMTPSSRGLGGNAPSRDGSVTSVRQGVPMKPLPTKPSSQSAESPSRSSHRLQLDHTQAAHHPASPTASAISVAGSDPASIINVDYGGGGSLHRSSSVSVTASTTASRSNSPALSKFGYTSQSLPDGRTSTPETDPHSFTYDLRNRSLGDIRPASRGSNYSQSALSPASNYSFASGSGSGATVIGSGPGPGRKRMSTTQFVVGGTSPVPVPMGHRISMMRKLPIGNGSKPLESLQYRSRSASVTSPVSIVSQPPLFEEAFKERDRPPLLPQHRRLGTESTYNSFPMTPQEYSPILTPADQVAPVPSPEASGGPSITVPSRNEMPKPPVIEPAPPPHPQRRTRPLGPRSRSVRAKATQAAAIATAASASAPTVPTTTITPSLAQTNQTGASQVQTGSSTVHTPPVRASTSTGSCSDRSGSPCSKPLSYVHVPSSPKFVTRAVQWRGLTIDAAKWTFTSNQLQDIVGRAIRQSAEASSIRLLTLDVFDAEIPTEIRHLEALKAEITGKYRSTVHRRSVLFHTLTLLDGKDSTKRSQVQQDLLEVSHACDQLTQDLFHVMDDLQQLHKLRDVHSASALAMALRKLNSSFLKQSTDMTEMSKHMTQLEAERDEAWATAERIEHDLVELQAKMDALNGESKSTNSPLPASNRSSRVSAARKTSIRASKASLRLSHSVRNSQTSSTSSHRSNNFAPPLPPMPRGIHHSPTSKKLSLNTDFPSASVQSAYSNESALGGSTTIEKELYDMLGISRADTRPRHSKRPISEIVSPSSLPVTPFSPVGFTTRPGSETCSSPTRRRRTASFSMSPRPMGIVVGEDFLSQVFDFNKTLS